jgi:FKBP-type peptidyl-prolyl cis-trans isomerase FkpA
MKLTLASTFSFMALLFLSACLGETNFEREEKEKAEIELYLKNNSITAQKDDNGVYYAITQAGTGRVARADSIAEVTINYKGYLLNKQIFDQSTAPVTFPLEGLIPGFQIGLSKMNKGSKASIFMVSRLGYASNPPQGIPSNAVLAFDIELLDLKTRDQVDEAIILKYIADNKLTMQKHSSGMYYEITAPGSGGSPSASSVVTVRYKGSLTDKTVFDQTTGTNTAEFGLSGLIEGWKIGIPLLKKGGKMTMILPSRLAYGNRAQGRIAPNSVLIFEIELVDFK